MFNHKNDKIYEPRLRPKDVLEDERESADQVTFQTKDTPIPKSGSSRVVFEREYSVRVLGIEAGDLYL